MKTIVFVTQNKYKLEDARKLLPEFEIEHVDFDVPEIQSLDPKEIIAHKLSYAYGKIGKPCFVMDSSLSLACLNGMPGPFIKWWFEKTVGEEKTCAIATLFGERGVTWTNVLGYFDGSDTALSGRDTARDPAGSPARHTGLSLGHDLHSGGRDRDIRGNGV